MGRPFPNRFLPLVLDAFTLLQARCTSPAPAESGALPAPSLYGQWRQDSGSTTIYNDRGQLLNQMHSAKTDPAGLMIIGSEQWHFRNGRIRAMWTYTRRADTLVLQRLVDSALVRNGHARWQDLGAPIALPDTFVIAALTARSWVSFDSVQDADGFLTRVNRTYYSQ